MINKIQTGKEDYLDLLLIADPSPTMIMKYLEKGDLYVLSENETAVCAAVVVFDGKSAEIKNLATDLRQQKKGYGKRMMEFLINEYAHADEIILGTGSTGDPVNEFYQYRFYEHCGFREYRTIKNFFIDNYPDPIFEDDGTQCVDMVYLRYTGKGINL